MSLFSIAIAHQIETENTLNSTGHNHIELK